MHCVNPEHSMKHKLLTDYRATTSPVWRAAPEWIAALALPLALMMWNLVVNAATDCCPASHWENKTLLHLQSQLDFIGIAGIHT